MGKRERFKKIIKEVVVKFKRRINIELRYQERLNIVEEKDFSRGKLLGKYIAKILYRWDNGKFEEKYLKKLERN